ncbi:hypothetical protein INT47_009143 [Mucor saturninus]|uniref:Uncharacterized protein n=1 Tax=Mucor saturninus TaxID=64648 RepID=A0A8H7RM30_9FUNG|nr:hypothetical protein INT47_009143 [Mucor saturninus]
MPAIDGFSMMTPEDLMNTSELSVSPILVSSIFDEIYTSPETLNVSDSIDRHHYRRSDNRITPRWRRRPHVINTVPGENADEEEDNIGPIAPTNYRFPRTTSAASFIYGQNCLNDLAVNTSFLCTGVNTTLDFDVIFDDGGQYGALYGIENILMNDGSVYCKIISDTSCSISKIVIKAPLHGFTAPCKDGLIFISHKEIDISETKGFDDFTKEQYDAYIQEKRGRLEDTDPVAWFTLKQDKLSVLDLVDRAGKFVLIKLLRADHESDNIDIQYIGFIGHAGPRSFGCAKLC